MRMCSYLRLPFILNDEINKASTSRPSVLQSKYSTAAKTHLRLVNSFFIDFHHFEGWKLLICVLLDICIVFLSGV